LLYLFALIAPILTLIFQISLESGVVSSDWKTAHVALVYKKGPKYNPENYRHIFLTFLTNKGSNITKDIILEDNNKIINDQETHRAH
jgi:hypothetical protein